MNQFTLLSKYGKFTFHTNYRRSLVYKCESGDVGSIPGCATNLQSVFEQVTYTKSLEQKKKKNSKNACLKLDLDRSLSAYIGCMQM